MRKEIIDIAENVQLKENEPVILQCWVENKHRWIMEEFERILRKRGYDVIAVMLDADEIRSRINKGVLYPEKLFGEDWTKIRNIIDLCEFSPTGLVSAFAGEELESFKVFMRTLFENYTKDDKYFLQIRVPSEENAAESGLPLEIYEARWKEMIRVDYRELKASAEAFEARYKGITNFVIITKDSQNKEHQLIIEVEGRSWYQDVANGDFPSGEVYIAPVESSAKGSYVASMVTWEDQCYEEVILEFVDGVLVHASEDNIRKDLEQAPGDSTLIGEFGVGINPQEVALCGYGLFDEKIKGTCHIAVGANYMFGGHNDTTPVHFDFVAKSYKMESR